MIKTKFGDSLRSKSQTAQINELLCKILCHNICVVIQEINELGVKAEFRLEETKEISAQKVEWFNDYLGKAFFIVIFINLGIPKFTYDYHN